MHFRHCSLNTSNGWFLVVAAFTCVSLSQRDINLAWPLSFHRCKAIHFHYLTVSSWFQTEPGKSIPIWPRWSTAEPSCHLILLPLQIARAQKIILPFYCVDRKLLMHIYIYISPGFSNEFTQGLECFLNRVVPCLYLLVFFFARKHFSWKVSDWAESLRTVCLVIHLFKHVHI